MLWEAVKEDPVIGWGPGVEEVVVGGWGQGVGARGVVHGVEDKEVSDLPDYLVDRGLRQLMQPPQIPFGECTV